MKKLLSKELFRKLCALLCVSPFLSSMFSSVGYGITWPLPPEGELPGGKLGSMIYTDLANNRLGVYTRAAQGKFLIQKEKESASGLISVVGLSVTGSGTFFTTELDLGDQISVDGETRVVTDILDDSHLVINSSFPIDFSDQAFERSESMFIILNDGHVGLGETFPQNKLDVSGSVVIGMSYSGVKFAPENGLLVEGAVGVGTDTPQNKLDVAGSVTIGGGYAGTREAPVDGLLVEGAVGVGTDTPKNKLDVEGGAAIGGAYSGDSTAPANGLLVEGRVGIGTDDPKSKVQIDGTDALRIPAGATTERPTTAMVGQVRYNTTLSRYEGYDGTGWGALGGSVDVDQDTQIRVEALPDEDKIRFDTLGLERMIIDSNGNVGVNTSSPQGMWQVQGDKSVGTGTISSVGLNVTGSITRFNTELKVGDEITAEGQTRVVTSITDANHLVIDSAFDTHLTNVSYLIGVTRFLVEEDGDTLIDGDLRVTGTASLNTVDIHVDDLGAPENGAFSIQTWETSDGVPQNRVTVTADGNVGFGTTIPWNALDVTGGAVIGPGYSGSQLAPLGGMLVEGRVGIGTFNPLAILDVNGGIALNVVEVSVDYTATPNDYMILCNTHFNSVTITLPPASLVNGLELTIKKIDESQNSCIIAPGGSDLLDGGNVAKAFSSRYVSYAIISDGARWWIK